MNDVTAGQSQVPSGSDRLSEVFATHHKGLVEYVYHRLNRPDWHLAEDLASETFVRLVRDYTDRPIDGRASGLLRTIARHVIADHFRLVRNSREAATDFGDWFEARQLPATPAAEDTAVVRIEARAMLADRPDTDSPAVQDQVDALTELAVAA